MVTSAKHCVKIGTNISFDQGACFFVNPFTAVMFAEVISTGKHRAAVHTAAASALGKMMVRWSTENNYPLINVVRRPEQVETLKEIGAKYVLNSSDPNFNDDLTRLCKELAATVAFDAVGGELTGILMTSLCENSVTYVYGALSQQNCSLINPGNLIFERKRLEGLWLTTWIQQKNLFGQINLIRKVQNLVNNLYKSDIAGEYSLEEIQQAIDSYVANMSAGKVLIKPSIEN